MSDEKGITVDVLVVGSGASGLTAAITAKKAGLDVLVTEKESVFGGASATSGGGLWVPCNHHARAYEDSAQLAADTHEKARAYVAEEAGNCLQPERLDVYLAAAPEMIRFMEDETHVRFYALPYPDYRSESSFSGTTRTLCPVNYDARKLGKNAGALKRPLKQTQFLGLPIALGPELVHFLRANRSLPSLAYLLKSLAISFSQRLRYGEGQLLVAGRALVARLGHTLFDLGVPLWLSSPVQSLVVEDGRVAGARIDTAEGVVKVHARLGVVLACGGYPKDSQRRSETFPKPARANHKNLAPMSNTGDGIRLAESAGGQFNGSVVQPAAWMPVSIHPTRSEPEGVCQHLVDRNKPGFIMVLPNGRRFANEALSYQALVAEMLDACQDQDEAKAWLIGDAKAFRRWGMGLARPFPVPYGHHIRTGYLFRGRSIADLAQKIGVPLDALAATIDRFNADARKGFDSEFGRGQRSYENCLGDPDYPGNPNLGPLERAPFFAVQIKAGLIGTFAGLRTDSSARVLNLDGQPVAGLYAVGNDQASVFSGSYPGAGATLGPGMTFGYIAGRHLAAQQTNLSSG
ncbi:MAG: FAD-dependent oxidoreductase [Caulobacterales bacterium]